MSMIMGGKIGVNHSSKLKCRHHALNLAARPIQPMNYDDYSLTLTPSVIMMTMMLLKSEGERKWEAFPGQGNTCLWSNVAKAMRGDT